MRDDPTIGVDERELDDVALEALAEAYATTPPAGAARARPRDRARRGARRRPGVADALARRRRARRRPSRWSLGGLLARERGVAGAARLRELAALARANAELAARLDEQDRTLVGLRESLDAQAQVLRVLGGPRTVTASLAPKDGVGGDRPGPRRRRDRARRAVVLAGLQALAAGKVYELWAIRGDRAAGAGRAARGRSGRAVRTRVREASSARARSPPSRSRSSRPAARRRRPGPIVLVGAVAG